MGRRRSCCFVESTILGGSWPSWAGPVPDFVGYQTATSVFGGTIKKTH